MFRILCRNRCSLSSFGLCVAVRELTEEERRQILMSDDFMRSFDRTARIIERAMSEQIDLLTDYTGEDGDDDDA